MFIKEQDNVIKKSHADITNKSEQQHKEITDFLH